MNSDTILKNRFWILVGLAAVFALVGWIIVLLTGADAAYTARNSIEKAWGAKKKYTDFTNQEFMAAMRAEAAHYNNQGDKIQGELYDTQMKASCLMTWPTAMQRRFDCRSGKYATELMITAVKGKAAVSPAAAGADKQTGPTRQISGTLIETGETSFQIKDNKDQIIEFLKTPKIAIKEGATKIAYGDLFKYKQGYQVTVTFVEGKYYGEDLTDAEILAYRDAYEAQLHDVLTEIGPVNVLGQPVVLFRYAKDDKLGLKPDPKKVKEDQLEFVNDVWIYRPKNPAKLPPPDTINRFFNYVFKWNSKATEISPEEIWTAQEAIWIQRELFKQIKAANDALAAFEKVSASDDGKSAKFKNFYWEIDLTVTDTGVEAKLKNLRPKAQNVDGLRFLLRFTDPDAKETKDSAASPPVVFPPRGASFEGQPVGPAGAGNDTFPAKGTASFVLKDAKLTSLESVQQLLTVETAAVKRLDVCAVGTAPNGDTAVSHKQSLRPLVPYKQKALPQKKAVDPDNPDKDDPGPAQPDPGPKLSPNKLILEHYYDVKPQFRKVPVNLVIAVSPEHVAWVQSYLVSSPLRFLPTQLMWHRTQVQLNALSPAAPDLAIGGGGDSLVDCVELTIYGIVTLYERPNRPKDI